MSGAGRRRPLSPAQQRFWGWHRLHPEWAQELVINAGVRPGQLVVDLGAGDGVITDALVAAGARVLAVELHPGRVDRLRERFADSESVRVIELDLLDFRLPVRPFRVVANPPWSLAKPIIRMLTTPASRLLTADLVLARRMVEDVAQRGTPGPGRTRFDCRAADGVPRAAFRPAPPHPAAVLRINRRSPLPGTRRRR